jgi:hypothetical protein
MLLIHTDTTIEPGDCAHCGIAVPIHKQLCGGVVCLNYDSVIEESDAETQPMDPDIPLPSPLRRTDDDDLKSYVTYLGRKVDAVADDFDTVEHRIYTTMETMAEDRAYTLEVEVQEQFNRLSSDLEDILDDKIENMKASISDLRKMILDCGLDWITPETSTSVSVGDSSEHKHKHTFENKDTKETYSVTSTYTITKDPVDVE